MIIGLGNDLADIRRVEKVYTRFGKKFLARVFTKKEQEKCCSAYKPPACYAKRFAAKEAFAKAVGCGIGEKLGWLDIELISDEKNKPALLLSEKAKIEIGKLLPAGYREQIHVSLSDEFPLAQATVIVSACKIS